MPSDFCHFEVYYLIWYEKFTQPADPLVLFIHWSMIQNRFKCFYDSELHDQLPNNWLNANGYYDFHYKKYDINYRLEIYITNDSLFVQLRNLSSFLDSTQYIKIGDFIDLENYKNNSKYKLVYKDMEKLYVNIRWSIDQFRSKKKIEKPSETKSTEPKPDEQMEVESLEQAATCSVSSSSTQVSKNKTRKETKKNLGLICDILTNNFLSKNTEQSVETGSKLKAVATYTEFLTHLKQEKAEFDSSVNTYRRNSTSSNRSSETLASNSDTVLARPYTGNARKKSSKKIRSSLKKKETEAQKPESNPSIECLTDQPEEPVKIVEPEQEPKPTEADKLKPLINRDDRNNVERDKINRNLLFDYNPITNYFYYNKKTDAKKIDVKIMEEDEFVQRAYKKFNMDKFCEIKLIDCFKTDLFKGLKAPIKLNDEMKMALDLTDENDDEYDDIETDKSTSSKKRGKKKNIWREKRRKTSKFTKEQKPVLKKSKFNKTNLGGVKSNNSSPLIVDSTSSEDKMEDKSEKSEKSQTNLMSFFKYESAKRKRSISSASSNLPDVDFVEEEKIDDEKEVEEGEKRDEEIVCDLKETSSYMSPEIKTGKSKETIFKKLHFSTLVKSSISIERVDKTNPNDLSLNLFAKESEVVIEEERPSKRIRKDSDEELVDLNFSIALDKGNSSPSKNLSKTLSETSTKTPSKTPSKIAQNKTPGKTPNKTAQASQIGTPKSHLKVALENIDEFISPKKFYKNYTSTQIVDTTNVHDMSDELIDLDRPIDLPKDNTVISKITEDSDDDCKIIQILDSPRVNNKRKSTTTRSPMQTRSFNITKKEPV